MPASRPTTPTRVRVLGGLCIATTLVVAALWSAAGFATVWLADVYQTRPREQWLNQTPTFLAMLACVVLWASVLVAPVAWGAWQHTVAVVASTVAPARVPVWHGFVWAMPLLLPWEPVRAVRELSSVLLHRGRHVVTAWAASWFAVLVGFVVIAAQMLTVGSLLPDWTGAVAACVVLAGAPLAVTVTVLLARAAAAVAAVPRTPYPARPVPYAVFAGLAGAVELLVVPELLTLVTNALH